MVWGILEDIYMEHVPGTVLLADAEDVSSEYGEIPREFLKRGRGRHADVILVPQPSDSPNDPLNWPTWRKDVILTIIGLSAAVVGAFGPMISPGYVEIAADLDITVSKLAKVASLVSLVIGTSLFIFNPIAKKFGRRPVYVISSTIMLTGSVWGAVAQNYRIFAASRIYSALGMAPYEILVQCTIADIYFVHERATRIAAWNFFLLSGISGGGLIAGYIIQDQGWKWTFSWCAILFGLLLPLVVLFVPETAYRRRRYHGRGEAPVTKVADEAPKRQDTSNDPQNEKLPTPPEVEVAKEPKDSFLRSLRLYSGIYTKTPLWKIFLRPIVILWYPAVLWGFLLFGVTLSWITVFSVTLAAIFTAPPYCFSVSQVGLIYLSPFFLNLTGEIISGPLSDWFCLWLAKKNRGIYEPEFRLPLVIISFLIGVTGFFGFGATVHYQTHWSGPVLCFGLANMSLAFSTTSIFGYIIDSHKELSEEAFVAINARSFLTFGTVYVANDWLARDGVLAMFNVFGGIFVAINVLTIPLWIFGKRIRGYIARNQTLRRFMHED
ncbi:major facilitator superfamily domain-containing protein [Xylaria nigripes]|nr:major facilitator superfamily domain-containing protein [Xylaria nigripes]